MKILLCLALFAFPLCFLPTQSQATVPIATVAEAYLDAYAALDFERLETYWTDASVWQDPTGAEIGASPAPVTGADAIRTYLKAATNGIDKLELTIDERFHSADHVVHVGTLRYTLDGAVMGAPGKTVPFEFRTVIVLVIEDGKVLRHTDLADFRDWRQQLADGVR